VDLFDMPIAPMDSGKYERADWFQARIKLQIEEFAEGLPQGQQVLARVFLANGEVITARWFGYYNPNILIINGVDELDRQTQVLVAQNAAQIVLTAVEPTPDKIEKIGFQPHSEQATTTDT